MTDTPKGLQFVRVLKEILLLKIRENREAHIVKFRAVHDAYKLEVTHALGRAFENAKRGDLNYWPLLREHTEPTDHTKDYDRAIAILEMSLDEELVLPDVEFSRYVLDEWDWSNQFAASTMKYRNNR